MGGVPEGWGGVPERGWGPSSTPNYSSHHSLHITTSLPCRHVCFYAADSRPLPAHHYVTSALHPPSVMAVRVRVPPGAPPEPLPVQLLPCRIQHDGPAPVAVFLRPRPGPELWASFRGRRLGGRELPLPAGYRGLLLRGEEPGDPSQVRPGGQRPPEPPHPLSPLTFGLARALQWGPLAQAVSLGGLHPQMEPRPLICSACCGRGQVSLNELRQVTRGAWPGRAWPGRGLTTCPACSSPWG
uniref:Uncharacterized protein n=1 Tax=Catharus ustulatus TaxID=91951 RepID=A0A8C3U449_CATUS